MNNNICPEMPSLIMLSDFNNDWNKYLDSLYEIYKDEFFNNTVHFKGLPIKTKTDLGYNLKQRSFNHVTTEGSKDRIYNEARCQRYMWIKAMIQGTKCNCGKLRIFPDNNGSRRCILIWCFEYDFLIVLEQRKDCYILTSAYCVLYQNKRNELNKKYVTYKNQKRL